MLDKGISSEYDLSNGISSSIPVADCKPVETSCFKVSPNCLSVNFSEIGVSVAMLQLKLTGVIVTHDSFRTEGTRWFTRNSLGVFGTIVDFQIIDNIHVDPVATFRP